MQFINLKQYDEVEIKKYSHFCSNLHSLNSPHTPGLSRQMKA